VVSPLGAASRTPLGAGRRSPLGVGGCCCICAPHVGVTLNIDSSFDGSCNSTGTNDTFAAEPLDGDYRLPSIGTPAYETRCENNTSWPESARFPIVLDQYDYPETACSGTPTLIEYRAMAMQVYYSRDGHWEPGLTGAIGRDVVLYASVVAYAPYPYGALHLFHYDFDDDPGFPRKLGELIPNQVPVGTPYRGGDLVVVKDW